MYGAAVQVISLLVLVQLPPRLATVLDIEALEKYCAFAACSEVSLQTMSIDQHAWSHESPYEPSARTVGATGGGGDDGGGVT
jgi:hypothetical protein